MVYSRQLNSFAVNWPFFLPLHGYCRVKMGNPQQLPCPYQNQWLFQASSWRWWGKWAISLDCNGRDKFHVEGEWNTEEIGSKKSIEIMVIKLKEKYHWMRQNQQFKWLKHQLQCSTETCNKWPFPPMYVIFWVFNLFFSIQMFIHSNLS